MIQKTLQYLALLGHRFAECHNFPQNVIPNVYLSVPGNLRDRYNHLICHFISCPVIPATHPVRS